MENVHWILILVFSLMPTVEGRYAIVYGLGVGLNPVYVFTLASLAIVALGLALGLLISYIDFLLLGFKDSKYRILRALYNFYEKYLVRVRKRARPYIDKYGLIGLIIFVAAPLPGTGVWTGALVSYIFGIEKRRGIIGLTVGGLLSNIIVFVLVFFFKIIL